MIRKMQNPDINRIADIWLKTNLKAHDFIPKQYRFHFLSAGLLVPFLE